MLRRSKLIVISTILLVFLVMIGIAVMLHGIGPEPVARFEPDRERFPLRGLDVSHHQKEIDWKAVSRDDVAFVILKATEGGDHRDTRFVANWAEARAAGITVGAYHFFTLCRPGSDQARNFISVVPKDGLTLPPAVDLEFPGNCPERPELDRFRQEIEAFLTEVETHFGRQVILYVGDDFLAQYGGALPPRMLWTRSIGSEPPVDGWTLWQYDDAGKVAGIATPVDLNVFRWDRAKLIELTGGSVQAGP